jgi:hypothetical protein
MAQVPAIAGAAAVRMDASVSVPSVPCQVLRLAAADEERLRAATTLDQRQVAVDELVVVAGAHEATVAERRDS